MAQRGLVPAGQAPVVATLPVSSKAGCRASAQVTVEIVLDQEQFLPSESVPVAVKITNTSGQRLHLGADADWLTFNVESADQSVVIKNSEVPVTGEFLVNSVASKCASPALAPLVTLVCYREGINAHLTAAGCAQQRERRRRNRNSECPKTPTRPR